MPRVVKRSAAQAIKSGPSRRGVPLPPGSGPLTGPNQKQGGPIRPPRGGLPYRATGERSSYIGPQAVVHWQSGGQ
jgi:hypothetical protein